jgi:HPr kinase/phosphorylase
MCRPGLALAGFMKRFPNQCVQLIGETEWAFLKSLSPARRLQAFDAVLSSRVPAVIFADNIQPDAAMVGRGRNRVIPGAPRATTSHRCG